MVAHPFYVSIIRSNVAEQQSGVLRREFLEYDPTCGIRKLGSRVERLAEFASGYGSDRLDDCDLVVLAARNPAS